MADKQTLLDALAPVLAVAATLDLQQAAAARATLATRFPTDGETWQQLKSLFAEGRLAGWLCNRENAGVRL